MKNETHWRGVGRRAALSSIPLKNVETGNALIDLWIATGYASVRDDAEAVDKTRRSPSPRDQASSAMLGALENSRDVIQIAINAIESRNPNSVCAKELTCALTHHRRAIALARSAGIETEENG